MSINKGLTGNLYLIAPLPTGEKKSDILREMFRPINDWEFEIANKMSDEIEKAKSKRANEEELIIKKRKRLGKKDSDESLQNEIEEMSMTLTPIPIPPTLTATDVTAEVTLTLLKNNNERLAFVDAEGGLFDNIAGRYNKGWPNLDIFLKGYSEDQVKNHRKSSGDTTILDKPLISFCISPQPVVVRKMAKIPMASDKGFLARFLYCYPEASGLSNWDTEKISKNTRSRYRKKIFDLLDFSRQCLEDKEFKSIEVRFDPDAIERFRTFWEFIDKEKLPGGELHTIEAWAKKFAGSTARIILLLHIMKYFDTESGISKNKIDLKTTEGGIALANALLAHAHFAFEDMELDENIEIAKKLLVWIKRERKQTVTKRDCHTKFRSTFKKADDIDPVLDELIKRNYIKPNTESRSIKAGRKSDSYIVNPHFFEE